MAGAAHIAEVMNEVRKRILTIKSLFAPIQLNVEIANPAQFHPRAADADAHLVTLFLYRIEPDHAALLSTPERGMAVRLKVMITVYGGQADGVEESIGTLEMRILSHIMRLFMEQPKLGPIKVKETLPLGPIAAFVTQGVTVEAQQLSLDMEEVNHIWTTQGDTPFRTSLVYSFNYALVVPATPKDIGPPVLATESSATPNFAPDAAPAQVNLGALALRLFDNGVVKLVPTVSIVPALGNISVPLLLVTEEAATFNLTVEKLNAADGTWVAETAQPAQINSLARGELNPSAVPAGTNLQLTNPSGAAVFRVSVTHPTQPESYQIGPVTLVVEAAV